MRPRKDSHVPGQQQNPGALSGCPRTNWPALNRCCGSGHLQERHRRDAPDDGQSLGRGTGGADRSGFDAVNASARRAQRACSMHRPAGNHWDGLLEQAAPGLHPAQQQAWQVGRCPQDSRNSP